MRRRYSDEQKHEILKDLRESGLSRAAYCRREGLCYQNVSRWVSCNAQESTSLALVEVQNDEIEKNSDIAVHVGGSVKVDFSSAVSMQQLALFFREVQRC